MQIFAKALLEQIEVARVRQLSGLQESVSTGHANTTKAIELFQKYTGLDQTGSPDPKTMHYIKMVAESNFDEGVGDWLKAGANMVGNAWQGAKNVGQNFLGGLSGKTAVGLPQTAATMPGKSAKQVAAALPQAASSTAKTANKVGQAIKNNPGKTALGLAAAGTAGAAGMAGLGGNGAQPAQAQPNAPTGGKPKGGAAAPAAVPAAAPAAPAASPDPNANEFEIAQAQAAGGAGAAPGKSPYAPAAPAAPDTAAADAAAHDALLAQGPGATAPAAPAANPAAGGAAMANSVAQGQAAAAMANKPAAAPAAAAPAAGAAPGAVSPEQRAAWMADWEESVNHSNRKMVEDPELTAMLRIAGLR